MTNVTTINSKRNIGEVLSLKNILNYKDLFFELVIRDIKIRHKQTILGVAWVIFQPLMSMIIFTLIFGLILKVPSNTLPYPLFVLIGLNFWNFFSSSLTSASGSLAGSESLIKKVYFPRIIVPISTIATNLFDFFISTLFLFLMLFYYRIIPNPWALILFPLSILLTLISSTGIGLFLAALNVRYRDVRQILPFFIQILIFLTPVFYPVGILSPSHQWILALNPLSIAIEITRSVFGGIFIINPINIGISIFVSIILLLIGMWYFAKTESLFADLI